MGDSKEKEKETYPANIKAVGSFSLDKETLSAIKGLRDACDLLLLKNKDATYEGTICPMERYELRFYCSLIEKNLSRTRSSEDPC